MLPRYISILVLLALVLLFGLLFYQVMVGFIVPVFIAIMAAVLFQAVFDWLVPRCRGSKRLAAALTTLFVALLVIVPTILFGFRAWAEAIASTDNDPDRMKLDQNTLERGVQWLNSHYDLNLKSEAIQQTLLERGKAWLQPFAQKTVGTIFEFITGMVIMLVSLYYFLIDGESMIDSVSKLLPIAQDNQRSLRHEFAEVSRAVAAATMLSAIVQGILAGIGFWMADLRAFWLLTFITMFASLIPFVGAAIVWIPCCLYLALFQDRMTAGIILAIYCVSVVSMVDNLIKPLILQGKTNLHPLLALLSVLGGVQALGPIGIFVGPMAVVFFQTALTMLQSELRKDSVK